MEDLNVLQHSTKLLVSAVGDNLAKIQAVSKEIAEKFNAATTYEGRISVHDLSDTVINTYPEDISNATLGDDRIIEIVVKTASHLSATQKTREQTIKAARYTDSVLPMGDPPF